MAIRWFFQFCLGLFLFLSQLELSAGVLELKGIYKWVDQAGKIYQKTFLESSAQSFKSTGLGLPAQLNANKLESEVKNADSIDAIYYDLKAHSFRVKQRYSSADGSYLSDVTYYFSDENQVLSVRVIRVTKLTGTAPSVADSIFFLKK